MHGTPTTRRGAISIVKRAFNWAADEELIAKNPLKKVRKPVALSRQVVLSPADVRRITETTDAHFRLFALALRHSGARPGEVARVTANMVDLQAGTWTFWKHKTGTRTGRPRIVYLSPCLVSLCRILMAARPSGPLFRNRYGKPWGRNAIRLRMKRLRKKLNLPPGTVAYAFRHTFTTEGLVNGVPIATMAELLGHVDTKMISVHYSHLSQKSEHLRRAVLQTLQTSRAEGA